jgi:hypothetical protein
MGDELDGPAASLINEREGLDRSSFGVRLRRHPSAELPRQRAELSIGRVVKSALSSESMNLVDCPPVGAQVDFDRNAAGSVESGPEFYGQAGLILHVRRFFGMIKSFIISHSSLLLKWES